MKTLKEAITALHERGYSQQRMAKIARVSQMTISRWSKRNPSLVNMKALERLKKTLQAESVKK